MRKSNVITAILSTASLICVAPAHAREDANPKKPPITLDYNLPEVKIGFAVSHMITACPDAQGKGFAMDTVTAISPIYGRGQKITINPKGNPFIDRQVKLEFYENGTLKSFNGSSTGQGGKIVAAAIKLASFAATTAMGVPGVAAFDGDGSPVVEPIQCTDEIAKLLLQKASLQAELALLKQALISQGPSDNLLLQITRTQAALTDAIAQLTVSPDAKIWTPTTSAADLPLSPDPADLSVWFKPVPKADLEQAFKDVGLGQVLNFTAAATFAATLVAPTTDEQAQLDEQRSLVYRVPGLVNVKLEPSAEFSFTPGKLTDVEAALARAAYNATKAKAKVKVPQIGRLKIIPFNGSGIFGSRAVAATFDQSGELTSIGYTSTGGADALAGVIDAGVAAATELRDQETNATKREVERRTQANLLEALIEAEAKAQDDAETAAED